MGNAPSARKITVNNENAHIIKVSDSVIERLKNVDTLKSPQSTSSASSNLPKSPTPSTVTTPSPASITYGGSLTSLQVLQEKEKQLKENDAYWANRVQELEGKQSQSRQLMEQEFTSTVSALKARLPKVPTTLSEAPCGDQKSKVLQCFQSHPKQILLCSKEVAEFSNCVDQKRLSAT